MAKTSIADVVVPDVFNPYVIEKTAELMDIYMGGIISTNPELNALAMAGGKLINMPFWSDLTGDDEVLSDSGSLTPAKLTSGQDIAALLMRGKAWSVNDLAKALSGDDPMAAVADLVAAYKVRKLQGSMIASLKGVFADNIANDSGDMTYSIAVESIAGQSAATKFSADAFIEALTGTMGDAWNRITGIGVHSAVFKNMQKLDLITYTPVSAQGVAIPTYLDRRVIVDDGCPVVAGSTDGFKYTSYLFGNGALGFGDGEAPVPTETDRDSLAGDDILIHRWHSILHPRGVKFASGSVAGSSPTNAELALAANWDRVYDRKNVRLAQLITNG
jgi:hypothetical protein